MLLQNKLIVRTADTKSRASTGTIYPPLVSVDGVESTRRVGEVSEMSRGDIGAAQWGQTLPTSLELLRRLESCVRELIAVSSKDR